MNESKKLIVTVVVFVLIALTLGGWMYTQMAHVGVQPFDHDESLRTKVAALDMQIANFQRKIDQIPAKEKEREVLMAEKEKANQLLPKEREPATLLKFIFAKAAEAGVDTRSVIPRAARDSGSRGRVAPRAGASMGGPKFEKWMYEIKLSGTYDQIGTFVNKMEEFEIEGTDGLPIKRFFAVQDIKIDAQDAGVVEGEFKHTANIVMNTYRYTGEQ